MRYRVLTSFSPEGYELCGKNFIETFQKFWPNEVKLLCAWEGQAPMSHLDGFDLLNYTPAKDFFERHKNNPMIAGKQPHPNWPWGKKWKEYNFKFDAYKFAHKIFAIGAAARFIEDGKLFWFDADVYTHRAVPIHLLDVLLPDSVSFSYLPRPDYTHSECGFIGINLDRLEARALVTKFEDAFANDSFIDDYECWHDSYVFDRLVEKMKPVVHHIQNTSRAQPFDNSILGEYMTHLKGRRKHGERGWVEAAQ